mgnify:CR=1 FL=1
MDAVSVFKSLGDPVRLKIVSLVASAGELCVCRIVEQVDLDQPAVSHHLSKLRQAGILRARKRGKWVYYSLDAEVINSCVLEPFNKMLETLGRQSVYASECCIDECEGKVE